MEVSVRICEGGYLSRLLRRLKFWERIAVRVELPDKRKAITVTTRRLWDQACQCNPGITRQEIAIAAACGIFNGHGFAPASVQNDTNPAPVASSSLSPV